jgi:predicted NAD/FAD-dependent oxidoreductase
MTDSKHYASHCTVIDVAVIGAGLAGLVCAQNLQQAGYRVAVVEKSRGVGGRLATRRLQGVHADHGVRYLNHQGELSEYLIQSLLKQGVIQSWIDQRVSPKEEVGREDSTQGICYSAPTGLTAVAKFLANGLQIHHEQRLVSLTAIDNQWQLELEAAQPASLSARAVVLAIPAPQALSVLEPLLAVGLPAELVQQVASVQFDPCLSAMAAYSATVKLEHPAIHLTNSPWKRRSVQTNSQQYL